jgi:hypothetical protein
MMPGFLNRIDPAIGHYYSIPEIELQSRNGLPAGAGKAGNSTGKGNVALKGSDDFNLPHAFLSASAIQESGKTAARLL